MKDLDEIKHYLRNYAKIRDWEKFHSPKNLAMALSVEASELVEIFQWLSEKESLELEPDKKSSAADEIADILLYLVRIADKLDIDITKAIAEKTKKNEAKYPADLVKGSAKKYTEY